MAPHESSLASSRSGRRLCICSQTEMLRPSCHCVWDLCLHMEAMLFSQSGYEGNGGTRALWRWGTQMSTLLLISRHGPRLTGTCF